MDGVAETTKIGEAEDIHRLSLRFDGGLNDKT